MPTGVSRFVATSPSASTIRAPPVAPCLRARHAPDAYGPFLPLHTKAVTMMVYAQPDSYTFRQFMRTNIVIDDKLIQDTMRATGLKTKREAVEQGLRALLQLARQKELRKLRGKIAWEGDLEKTRTEA